MYHHLLLLMFHLPNLIFNRYLSVYFYPGDCKLNFLLVLLEVTTLRDHYFSSFSPDNISTASCAS